MIAKLNIERGNGSLKSQRLNVDVKNGHIKFSVGGLRFVDKDTQQIVIYLPSLDVSSYGETHEKAEEMMHYSLENFCEYLLSLTEHEVSAYLRNLGWTKRQFFSKQYSSAYVDDNGQLQNFNAVDNKVEKFSLSIA